MSTLINDIDHAYFLADIENRTRDLTARVAAHKSSTRGVNVVHPFVIDTAKRIIDLIGYASDSSLDDYGNWVDSHVDVDYMEEYLVCGYNDDAMRDPNSAEYRAFATEVDEHMSVYNHLTDAERKLLSSVSDVWGFVDDDLHDDKNLLDTGLREYFDRVMTFAETAAIAS
jgi:hypothetical protein